MDGIKKKKKKMENLCFQKYLFMCGPKVVKRKKERKKKSAKIQNHFYCWVCVVRRESQADLVRLKFQGGSSSLSPIDLT